MLRYYTIIILLLASAALTVDWWSVSRYLRRRTPLAEWFSRLKTCARTEFGRWWRWVPLALGVNLGLRIPGLLSTPLLVVIGWYASRFWEGMRGGRGERYTAPHLAQAVRLLRSRYELQPNLWAALELAGPRFPEPYRAQAKEAVNALYAGLPAEKAFEFLTGEGHFAGQWRIILLLAGRAGREAVLRALSQLAERVETWSRITEETETALLEVTGQLLVVLGAAVGLLLAIAHVEALRAAYTSSLAGQVRFCVLLGLSTVSSAWIFRRAEELTTRRL